MLYHKEKSQFISDGNSLTSFYRLGKLVFDFRLVKTGFHETHFWLKKKRIKQAASIKIGRGIMQADTATQTNFV